jgi:hypothetical protein
METGRVEALRTAAYFGVHPSRRNEAIHQRYLARRALRLGLARTTALRHALAGVSQSPAGFLSPVRRGGLTLVAALCATVLPRRITRQFFSR